MEGEEGEEEKEEGEKGQEGGESSGGQLAGGVKVEDGGEWW